MGEKVKIQQFMFSFVASSVLALSANATLAQVLTKDVTTVAPVWRTDLMGSFTVVTPLIKMVPGGQADSIRMSGMRNEQYFDFGVRTDELVSAAKIELNFTPSPSLIPTRSQLNVFLNGQLQQTIAIAPESLGKLTRMEVALDPKEIKAQNQIRFQFIGHYQQLCESPASETLWLDVDSSSQLNLLKQKVRLTSDLSKLPAPFIETVSNATSVVPFVFSKAPDNSEKTAAGILASLGGLTSGWRGVDYPVYYNQVPAEGHFVVFVTNDSRPDFLKDLPKVDAPQLIMMDAPQSRYAKMLVVAGRNTQDLLVLAKAMASGEQVLIGDRLTVKGFKEAEARTAYDAPNWIKLDEPVSFKDLMQYPGQLTSRGFAPAPVHLTARLAPDLFMVGNGSVDMALKYRYTKPEVGDTAQLRVRINDYLLDSFNLSEKESRGDHDVKLLNFYGALATSKTDSLTLASENDLSFEVGYTRTFSEGSADNCKSVVMLPQQVEIDPSSTMTLKGLYHYAKLPNLSLYTQSGFPFTKYADLSQTLVLMDANATSEKMTTFLNAMGRVGATTGVGASKLRVTDKVDAKEASDKDILVIGELPVALVDFKNEDAEDLQQAVGKLLQTGTMDDKALETQRGETLVNPEGGIGAIVSLRSPFDSDRTVVAILSEGEAGSYLLNEKLKAPSSINNAKGSVSIVQAQRLVNFEVGETYYLGDMPWYYRLWHTVGQYPLILVLCTLVVAALVGAGIFYFMRLWVRRRG